MNNLYFLFYSLLVKFLQLARSSSENRITVFYIFNSLLVDIGHGSGSWWMKEHEKMGSAQRKHGKPLREPF